MLNIASFLAIVVYTSSQQCRLYFRNVLLLLFLLFELTVYNSPRVGSLDAHVRSQTTNYTTAEWLRNVIDRNVNLVTHIH